MTTIKVTPEQLLSVSKQFTAAQSQIAQMNHILKQQLFEVERQWNGSTKERFYADFIAAQRVMDNFSSLSLSIAKTLEGHAEKFRLADQQTVQSFDANGVPPPPDECRAPAVDNRNAFHKSVDSLAELGTAYMQAADGRYQKRYDSVGGFLDYWTFGIPSGLVEGYMDRADKAFASPNDTANWLTFGIHGTIREAIFPTNAWSSEHWANVMGMGGMMVGGGFTAKMIKPHNLLTSSRGGTKVSAFNRPAEMANLDYKEWADMPVSGQVKLAPNGQRIISVRDLKRFTKDMNEQNIEVVIDGKGKILPEYVAGGFDPKTGQIVLKKEPTYLSAMHESYHAKHWIEIGKEEYLKLPVLEREGYVYNQIMNNKELYTFEEILFSQRYMYKLKNGEWPPPEWSGFE